MIATVRGARLFGEVSAPPSKSLAHRLLIAASLKKGETEIRTIGNSEDVLATVRCLRALGAEIALENGNATVRGIEQCPPAPHLDAGESGSTLRFMLPLAATLTDCFSFGGTKKLLSRPNGALLSALLSMGTEVSGTEARGRLRSGEFILDASVSSQYTTGLLLALPTLSGDSRIRLVGDVVSRPYLDITLSVLDLAGIRYQKESDGFTLFGNQAYRLPDRVLCEGDWSGAAFPLVAGALFGAVTVKGLDPHSTQGDRSILSFLQASGASLTEEENAVTVRAKEKKGFSVDLTNAPDLAPVLSVLASACQGESRLYGVERLRVKESDRIEAILSMLRAAKIPCSYNGEYIAITGAAPTAAEFCGQNDHRIVMSAALLASLCEGESRISTAEAVKKSYPAFFEDLKKLGGYADVGL